MKYGQAINSKVTTRKEGIINRTLPSSTMVVSLKAREEMSENDDLLEKGRHFREPRYWTDQIKRSRTTIKLILDRRSARNLPT